MGISDISPIFAPEHIPDAQEVAEIKNDGVPEQGTPSFLFQLFSSRYFPKQRKEDAHDGTQYVEEAEGKIDKGGYAENSRLGHSTGGPRNKHGGDSGRVLCTTTQELWLITSVGVFFLVD